MTYNFKDSNIPPARFIEFKGPKAIFKDKRDGNILLEDVEKEQNKLKVELNHIRQGNPENRSREQKNTINNIDILCKSRERVAKIFNDYAKNMSKNIYESKQGEGLKILATEQMLQRLPIALAQMQAGNNSESLLNEIRQIVYSLYQSKEITRKLYNNIIKSIKV